MFGPSDRTLSDERLARYEADRTMLAVEFPGLKHIVHADGTGAEAAGTIPINVGAGTVESIEVAAWFPHDYPRRPPTIYDAAARWTPDADRHIMPDHSFCLWLEHVDEPDVSTVEGLREFLLRLVVFLQQQFLFDDLGRWPTPDWAHGRTPAYAQHVREVLALTSAEQLEALWPLLLGAPQARARRCPCGSARSYGRCHYEQVRRLRPIRPHLARHQDAIASEIRKHLDHDPPPTAP